MTDRPSMPPESNAHPPRVRITIRLDDDVVTWFKTRVEEAGGGSYQNLIQRALNQYILDHQESDHQESREELFRRVLREELKQFFF